jgi:hypothetical protein
MYACIGELLEAEKNVEKYEKRTRTMPHGGGPI